MTEKKKPGMYPCEADKFCDKCGKRCKPKARYCGDCGKELPK